MPPRIGDTFAEYRVLRLLGSGGMGEVYLVQHPRLPRQEALKVLRPDISRDASFRERFIREADLAAGLRHPHVVGIHDRGEHDGQLWIAMDYIEGTDLSHLLELRYPAGMPAELAIPIITTVASALDYAHKKGLLHRDVKPANIIVADHDSDDPSVFLADFGIARPLDDTSGITTTNMTVGTVAYAAPEQLMGEPIDGRADQYALAATIYHLLTGAQLFPHSNPAVVISRHLNASPPPLSRLRPELVDLDPILAIALSKEPGERFSACSDFAHALASARANGGAGTKSSGPTVAAPVAGERAAPGATQKRPTPSATKKLSANRPPQLIEDEPRPRRAVTLSTMAVIFLLAAVPVAFVVRQWEQDPASNQTTNTPTVPSSSITFDPSPPSPPSFSPRAIDEVLLTAAQLSKLLGVHVTDDPTAGYGGGRNELSLNFSSDGTSDSSGQVTPSSCVGVVFTAQHEVYAANEPAAIKTQTFGYVLGSGWMNESHLVQQSAAVFTSAAQAQAFLTSSQAQWETCAKGEVDATFGENHAGYLLGGVERTGDLIAVSMATNGGMNGPDACQQALGVRENVVVESRTCQVPDVVTSYDPAHGWPRDPAWAGGDAKRVANAMLENVAP